MGIGTGASARAEGSPEGLADVSPDESPDVSDQDSDPESQIEKATLWDLRSYQYRVNVRRDFAEAYSMIEGIAISGVFPNQLPPLYKDELRRLTKIYLNRYRTLMDMDDPEVKTHIELLNQYVREGRPFHKVPVAEYLLGKIRSNWAYDRYRVT